MTQIVEKLFKVEVTIRKTVVVRVPMDQLEPGETVEDAATEFATDPSFKSFVVSCDEDMDVDMIAEIHASAISHELRKGKA